MTACAAKLCNSAICFSGERPHLLAVDEDRPEQGFVLTQGHPKRASRAAQIDNGAPLRLAVAIGVLFPHVGDRDDVHSREDTPGNRARGGRGWVAAAVLGVCRRDAPQSRRLQALSLHHMEFAESAPHRRIALSSIASNTGVEIAGRGIDDLQHLGGRGLLLQSLTRLGNEPRVLHRNDRLRREVLQKRDLLVGKRARLQAVHSQDPKQGIVLAQGNTEQTTAAANVHKPSGFRVPAAVKLTGTYIRHMDDLHAADDPHPCVAGLGQHRTERQQAFGIARLAMRRDKVEKPAVIGSELPMHSFTKPHCLFQHRLEHRLKLAGRGIDDLQHLGDRLLLLQ